MFCSQPSLCDAQVLAETGRSKAIAFDMIDKVRLRALDADLLLEGTAPHGSHLQAPEEKARGITIATAHGEGGAGAAAVSAMEALTLKHAVQSSTRPTSGTMPTWTAPGMPTT